MNYCGLICEYNPLHSGHAYQLKKIKDMDCVDALVLAMSGNFVQRAEPAIVDKNYRATLALNGGADAVIQIPSMNTVCGGERFAKSSLKLLSGIKNMRYLAFGCETESFELLEELAKIRAAESELFKEALKELLDQGVPYPSALTGATLRAGDARGLDVSECGKILSRPNNILAIEYLKIIYQNNYDIKPIFIHRQDNYNNKALEGEHASATSIREAILKGEPDLAQGYLPYSVKTISDNLPNYSLFDELILFSLRQRGTEGIAELADCAEGIENKLYKNALKCTDLVTALDLTKSKRYTYARLKRIAVQSLLSIIKDCLDDESLSYGRLLGIKRDLKKNLSDFDKNIIVKFRDTKNISSPSIKKCMEIDILSDDIYSQLTSRPAGAFFKNKLIEC